MRILSTAISVRAFSSGSRSRLLDHAGDDTRADRPSTLSDGEAQRLLDGDGLNQIDDHVDIVTRHHHLNPFGQLDAAGDVRRTEVKLRSIAGEEWFLAATFLRC